MTPIPVTDRLYLAWDDFNWVVLRRRKKTKPGAKDTYHPRYYAHLSQALLALLNEIPKGDPSAQDIGGLIDSVTASEARLLEVVAELERTGVVRRRRE